MLRKIKLWDAVVLLSALVVGVLGTFGVPQRLGWFTPEQIIIGLLTLILASVALFYLRQTFDNEKQFRKINSDLRRYVDRLSSADHASLDGLITSREKRVRLKQHLSFEEIKKEDVEVYVSGISCAHFISINATEIRDALISGAKFTFVLVDPAVNFLGLYDVNMENQSSEDGIRSDIKRSVSILEHLKPHGSLQWKYYPGVPMYSAVWLKSEDKNAIFVEFYTYAGSPSTRPGFEVNHDRSPDLYNFFARSMDELWKASR